jgi:hypothetical protein
MSIQSQRAQLIFSNAAGWRRALKNMRGVQQAIDMSVLIEDRWFDFHYNVDTSPRSHEQENHRWREDKVNFHYLPIRPKCIRRVLRHLPVKERDQYVFIDFGSGKGRALLVAASQGFRQLRGIELRKELHDQACTNFNKCRNLSASTIESINMDACEFEFPNEKMVVFFFNPFGRQVMERVIQRLAASLDKAFRDVWVVLYESTCADLVDGIPQLRLEIAGKGYRIYHSVRCQSMLTSDITEARP